MSKIRHTQLAKEDLLSIWAYIAEDSPSAADRLLDTIEELCDLLSENPQLGQARPDIAQDMRYFPLKNYLILYRQQIHAEGIEVVRVVHGSRDLNTLPLIN